MSTRPRVFVQRYVLTDIRDPDMGDPLLDDFLIRRDALSYGVELMVRRPVGAAARLARYTLSRSLRAFEGGVGRRRTGTSATC